MTIAWLSGSSDPARSALTDDELGLLEAVAGGRRIVTANFPWPDRPGLHRNTRIVLASVRNGVQFWQARLSGRYRAWIAGRILTLLGTDDLVLVTGSQGLELLRCAWPELGADAARIRVVALGPVARQLPTDLRPFVIQSADDRISRLGWRGPVDLVTAGSHLGYAGDSGVRSAARAAIAAATRR